MVRGNIFVYISGRMMVAYLTSRILFFWYKKTILKIYMYIDFIWFPMGPSEVSPPQSYLQLWVAIWPSSDQWDFNKGKFLTLCLLPFSFFFFPGMRMWFLGFKDYLLNTRKKPQDTAGWENPPGLPTINHLKH